MFLLSDGEAGGSTDALVAKAKALSKNGAIHCHTTSFFAGAGGKKLLSDIAAVTNGSFYDFQ